MSKTTNMFSPEVRERAVRLVLDNEGQHGSRWHLFDPEVTLTLDPTALPPCMSRVIRGAATVAALARVEAARRRPW